MCVEIYYAHTLEMSIDTQVHAQICMICIHANTNKRYQYHRLGYISSDLVQKCLILISEFPRQLFTLNERLFYLKII